jgi:fructokinase
MMRIGVDLGGTKIEIIALDDQGMAVIRRRIPTPSADYAAIVRAIVDLVVQAQKEIGEVASVGVATPGAISATTGLIKNSNSTVLNGRPLLHDIATALGQPVRIENDANCLAISEAADGAAVGAKVVFGAILGTGVGGGCLRDAIGVPASGGTIRCRGPTTANAPGIAAIAGRAAASRRFFPARGSHGNTSADRGGRWLRRTS